MSNTKWHPQPTKRKCKTCGSLGFLTSPLGKSRCSYCDGTEGGHPPTLGDCAERIEELETKLRKSALQELASLGQASEAYQAQLAAEAKLAKAVTRLQHIAANKTTDELTVIEWDTYDMFTILNACISEARTTLAELKGETNE